MRFCPFCSAENADELQVCSACGRRLPPLPPRRPRNAPPTGVQLPPRTTAAPGPRKSASAPAVEDPPTGVHAPTAAQIQADDAARRELLNAITPGPAAQRRDPPPADPRTNSDPARRRGDSAQPPIQNAQPARPDITGVASASRAGALLPPRRTPDTNEAPVVHEGPTGRYPERAPSEAGSETAVTRLNDVPHERAARSSDTHETQDRLAAVARSSSDTHDAPAPPPVPRRPAKPSPAPPIPPQRPPVASTMIGAPTLREPSVAMPRANPDSATQPAPRDASGLIRQNAAANPSGVTPAMTPAAIGAMTPTAINAAAPEETPPPLPAPPIIGKAESRGRFGVSFRQPDGSLGPDAGSEPPPTRVQRPDQLVDRPFAPPKVLPIPEIPEPGLVNAAKYAVRFWRARVQRRGAIRILGQEIKQDTEALDHVLGALGREARTAGVDSKVFSAENAAINAAEERVQQLHREHTEVDARKADETSKFVDVEREKNTKLGEAERMVEEGQRELQNFEAQQRGLRDKRKELERRQRAYLKAAEDHDRQAGSSQLGDQRSEMRRAAEGHRKEAAALEPDRQEIDRRLAALQRPIGEATAKLDAAKGELDAAKRSLGDAREGHTHRLAELDAEHKRKSREIALAEGEISRRLVTLGTLVNLNRIEDPAFHELYQRIDRLRGAITARTTEIEKLTAERDAFDRGMLVRGITVIGGSIVALIALIVILRAIL